MTWMFPLAAFCISAVRKSHFFFFLTGGENDESSRSVLAALTWKRAAEHRMPLQIKS